MLQLLFPGEGKKDTRQIATIDLFSKHDERIIDILATKRLLVTGTMHDGKKSVEIIHEALIDNWDRLKTWIDKHRPFRLWQNRIRVQIAEWEKNKKDNSFLLRGRQIEEALEYNKKYQLPEGEKGFITISKKKERRKTIIGIFALVVFILSLSIFAIYSNYQKNIADKIAQTSLKSYIGILIDTYRPYNKTYNEKYLDTLIELLDQKREIQSKVLELMQKEPNNNDVLYSRTNADFNKLLRDLYFNENITLKNEMPNLLENTIWSWSDEQLNLFSKLINNKNIVNLENFYKKEQWIYLSKVLNFASNPKEDTLNELFTNKYFTQEDKNASIPRGLDVIFNYDTSIISGLHFTESNKTKKQGHKKFSNEQLKEMLYNHIRRIQKIGNLLFKHSKKYPKKYTSQDLKDIRHMYYWGIYDVKTNNKMNKSLFYYFHKYN
jgi:hypothetical protein